MALYLPRIFHFPNPNFNLVKINNSTTKESILYYWYGFRAPTTIDIKSKNRCGFKELRHPESIIHWNDNNGPQIRPSIDRNGQDK